MRIARRLGPLALAAYLVGLILAPTPAITLITTTGKNNGIERLINDTGTPAIFKYVAVGNGDGSGTCNAAAAGDTTLQGEIGTRQNVIAATPDPPTVTGQQALVATFAAGNATGSLCEVGVLNAAFSGTLLQRSTYAVVTKAAGDSLQVTVTLTLS